MLSLSVVYRKLVKNLQTEESSRKALTVSIKAEDSTDSSEYV